jgi:carbon monoxide dehydrogenase subunit G
MVSGTARVLLVDEDEGSATLLTYEVAARVGGRLAQLGGPIIDATAKQLASAFFKKLGVHIADPQLTMIPAQLIP